MLGINILNDEKDSIKHLIINRWVRHSPWCFFLLFARKINQQPLIHFGKHKRFDFLSTRKRRFIKWFGRSCRHLHKIKLRCFFLDYRGFGKSEGKITSKKQLFDDNQMVYNELTNLFRERVCANKGDFENCWGSLITYLGEYGWQPILANLDFEEQQTLYQSFEANVFNEI